MTPTKPLATKSRSFATPAYLRIEEDLRRRIRSGQWAPGYQIPGRRELAKHYNVEVNTLQRALLELIEDGTLRAEKRRGTFVAGPEFESVADQIDFAGDSFARGPMRGFLDDSARGEVASVVADSGSALSQAVETRVSAVAPARFVLLAGVTPYRELPTSGELWSRRASSSFEREVQSKGHSTHIVNLMDRPVAESTRDIAASLAPGADVIAYFADGSLSIEEVAHVNRFLAGLLRDERYQQTRVIRVEWSLAVPYPADTVTFSGALGSQMATEYLLSLGHRDILFAASNAAYSSYQSSWERERITGFYRAFFEAGGDWEGPDRDPTDPASWTKVVYAPPIPSGQQMWFQAGEAAWKVLRERSTLPTAIVAANDQFACAFVEAARADGVDVPGELSVIGYDDRYCSAAMNLTTIHVPVEELGMAAANLALETLRTPDSGVISEIILKPSLVVRGTTGPARRLD
ncbi:MAG TPA: substrate-binding domain-containing protein [Capsulimonadaceae bacterium]|jgi:DNA-binding LacI/PurR family transcriptional regulator/DNA-binding transcriptional regulator YhcF (GntR family)